MKPVSIIDAGVGGIVNVFFLKGDKTVIVDAGTPGTGRKVLQSLERHGIAREDVSLLLITHGHSDHFGGAPELVEALKVPVMAGWPDAQYLEKGNNAPVVPYGLVGKLTGSVAFMSHPEPLKVDVIVREDRSLADYGVDARVMTTPGHTFGSLSVVTPDGDCIIGDLLMRFIRRNSPDMTVYAEAPESIGPSLKKVLDSSGRYLYPSHGHRWNVTDVRKKFGEYLR